MPSPAPPDPAASTTTERSQVADPRFEDRDRPEGRHESEQHHDSDDGSEEDDGEDEEEEEDEDEEEEEEPRLKYACLTRHLPSLYRNGDATSAFIVGGDKMVFSSNCHDLSMGDIVF